MNRNFYLNFIMTAVFFAVIFFGFAMVRSVDLRRMRLEKISEQLGALDLRIANLEKNLQGAAHARSEAAKELPSKISARSPEEIANYEFYDRKAEDGGYFRTAIYSETKNMNSLVNNEAFVSELWDYTYDSLAERNYKNFEIFQPKLAESWSISEDKLVYTVKLKKGVLWHDFKDPVSGKEWKDVEVKAADFKFYVDVIKNPDTDCAPARVYLQDLDRLEIISDYEFKVYWKRAYFESQDITLGLIPLPRHLYYAYEGPFDGKKFNDDHERNRIIVGCGPYMFDKWDKGQRIILKKWDKYFGRDYGVMPPLENMIFEVIKHPNTRYQALLSDALDSITLTPEQWMSKGSSSEFLQGGPLRKLQYPQRSYNYIGYNLKNPIFQDKKVRQALSHLVDKEKILKDVYYGLGRVISGPFFIDSPYYDQTVKPYDFSIEKAKRLLKEAGWSDKGSGILEKDGRKFEFTILAVAGHPLQPKILGIVQQDFEKAGIVMKIQSVEWSVYVQRIEKKNFDVCILGWALGLSPDPYQLWHSSQADLDGSSNHISFKNAEADRLIEEIRVTFDLKKRIELCHKFHQLLNDEQPYTFLINPYNLEAISTKFKNVNVFPIGVPMKPAWLPRAYQKSLKE